MSCWVWRWKNFGNRSVFSEAVDKSIMSGFLTYGVYRFNTYRLRTDAQNCASLYPRLAYWRAAGIITKLTGFKSNRFLSSALFFLSSKPTHEWPSWWCSLENFYRTIHCRMSWRVLVLVWRVTDWLDEWLIDWLIDRCHMLTDTVTDVNTVMHWQLVTWPRTTQTVDVPDTACYVNSSVRGQSVSYKHIKHVR